MESVIVICSIALVICAILAWAVVPIIRDERRKNARPPVSGGGGGPVEPEPKNPNEM